MDVTKYTSRLETEILRLQDLLDQKEIDHKDKVCDAYNAGFKEGIKNGEQNIKDSLENICFVNNYNEPASLSIKLR